eukprot:gene13109-3896_t
MLAESFTKIALHTSTTGNITFYTGKRETLFNGKPPPLDHTVKSFVAKTLSTPAIAVMWSFAAFGLIVACFFLYFNIRYRENRLIKMSSPMINNVIIIGSILCYVAVILFGLDTRLIEKCSIPRMCNAFVWILSFGFTLSFGALFSKTWRVYKIFTAAKSMERVAILDRHLFGIIFILIGVDVILLTMWMIVSPYNLKITEISRVGNIMRDVIEVTQVFHCSAKFGLYFSSATIAYKGILLFFGLFLAWETRHVEVPALNDSKFIGMAVYNVAAISAIGVTCTYALSDAASNEASYTIVCLCIILCTTVTLCLVFLPKLTLLFGKEANIIVETSRLSTLKNRPASTISVAGKVHQKEPLSNGRNGSGLVHAKHSVTTLSSIASLPTECGLNSFDTKAWSASMSELSSSCRSEETLASSVSTTLPLSTRKQGVSGMPSNGRVYNKSGSMCELTSHKRKVSDAPYCGEVKESPEEPNTSLSESNAKANAEESMMKLPNGVSIDAGPEPDVVTSPLKPRILPKDEVDTSLGKKAKVVETDINADPTVDNDDGDANSDSKPVANGTASSA